MDDTSEYVTLTEAVKLLGTTLPVLKRRIDSGDLPVFCSGKDLRWRLVAKADLAELSRIKPLLERSVKTSDSRVDAVR